MLWYIIKILKYNNFNHIILPLGYKGNLIKEFIKKHSNFRIKVEIVYQLVLIPISVKELVLLKKKFYLRIFYCSMVMQYLILT